MNAQEILTVLQEISKPVTFVYLGSLIKYLVICWLIIFGLSVLYAIVQAILNFLKIWLGEKPKRRAWKLLARFLTSSQKEQGKKTGYVVEKGKFGTYEIPLIPGYLVFHPDLFSISELASQLDPFLLSAISEKRYICLSNTASDSPWYDAVLTFIFHIRSGKEQDLFVIGNWH
ncbi:MAG: hypothetical protein M1150_00550 [Patescibacteria group bacterium]|nr:hypothetical protein [Patescibacteria group bacterium]